MREERPVAAIDPEEPVVSVLMPCFNTPGEYLREAARSVLRQGVDVELVLQDGGSTRKDTCTVLEELAGHPQVRFSTEPDAGQADALNKALARARGPLVGWLNADDLYVGDLRVLAKEMSTDPGIAGAYGDMEIRDAGGHVLRRFQSSDWSYERIVRRGCYVFSGSLLLRTAVLRGAGGFDSLRHYCMDLDMYLRLGTQVRMSRVPGPMAALRLHKESKTGSVGRRFAREAKEIRLVHARTLRDRLRAHWGYLRTVAVVTAQPIRMSRPYARLRGERRL
jgi:glycosyltransferase involved in cell wall biosynthesis